MQTSIPTSAGFTVEMTGADEDLDGGLGFLAGAVCDTVVEQAITPESAGALRDVERDGAGGTNELVSEDGMERAGGGNWRNLTIPLAESLAILLMRPSSVALRRELLRLEERTGVP